MDPKPPVTPSSDNPYQFITDPVKPPRKPLFSVFGSGSLVKKLIVIIGGAVVFMIVATMITNLVFKDKTNVEDLVVLTQQETEISLLSQKANFVTDQAVKDAAANTGVTVESHKQHWLTFLAKHGREVGPKELVLKHDAALDKRLTDAQQTSTFDTTFSETMRDQLDDYAKSIKTAFNNAGNADERAALKAQSVEVQLLLKQWPAAQVPATNL